MALFFEGVDLAGGGFEDISGVRRGAVVGGKKDECVLVEILLFESVHDAFHGVIDFHDEIAIDAELAFALPVDAGAGGSVRGREGEEQEEGFVGGLVFDEGFGFAVEGFEDFVVFEALFGGADAVEGAPSLLGSNAALPDVVAGEGVGIHVE